MAKMFFRPLVVGPLESNCYLVGCEVTKKGVIIDPADDAATILSHARKLGLDVMLIVATHAHFDHIVAVKEVKQATAKAALSGDFEKVVSLVEEAKALKAEFASLEGRQKRVDELRREMEETKRAMSTAMLNDELEKLAPFVRQLKALKAELGSLKASAGI